MRLTTLPASAIAALIALLVVSPRALAQEGISQKIDPSQPLGTAGTPPTANGATPATTATGPANAPTTAKKNLPGFGDEPVAQKADTGQTGFVAALEGAVTRYGKPVTFDDPQKHLSFDFFMRTGDADLNQAPGGPAATAAITKWLAQKIDAGGTTQEDLIQEALEENHGNLTLAMASLAHIFNAGEHRAWAAKVAGLPNDGKDYYRFAGAYAALQKNPLVSIAGYGGGLANIAGNPIVFGMSSAYHGVIGAVTGKKELTAQAKGELSRLKPMPNLYKLYEFDNVGYTGASNWMLQHQVEEYVKKHTK